MPVNYLPCGTTLVLLLIPVLLLIRGKRAALIGLVASCAIVIALISTVYIPGAILAVRAHDGSAVGQFEYARWKENHCGQLQQMFFWPCTPDVKGGYYWLEKSAAQDYPIAVWLVGVRLKYGTFVPRPKEWGGPDGNVFPQPEKGQRMIDRAVNDLGFHPPGDEKTYYWKVYRQ